MTYMADHVDGLSHDAINRFLRNNKLTARIIWEHVKGDIIPSDHGCLVFDDSILDKGHSHCIEMVKLQYSGNAHGLVKGISMVNCLYVNPETQQYWITDYRIYAPENDGKSKLDHVREMLQAAVTSKALPFNRVLMDSWYATKDLMLLIDSLGKIFYCPIKANRQVDDSGGVLFYRRVDSLGWSEFEKEFGKSIKIKEFPKDYKVKLFRVEVSSNRTDWVVTNDSAQNLTQGTQNVCALRWKIEQFHRELKQLTGVEKCQARKARIQRNHIACAVLVWIRLTAIAWKAGKNIYQLKKEMLSNYLRQELRSPAVPMRAA
jgi:hypothetical protein